MYKIYIHKPQTDEEEKLLYYPGGIEHTLTRAVLSLKIGAAGEFEFNVPLSNPLYKDVFVHNIVRIVRDDVEFWRGEIRDVKTRFDKSLEVYAIEDMAWLGEETIPMTVITNENNYSRFTNAVNTYNTDRTEFRKFVRGNLTTVNHSSLCKWQPEYEMSMLAAFRTFLAGDGYVRIRREHYGQYGTRRWLDIVKLEDYGKQSKQWIEFASNLLDFVKEMDITNWINVLYPYGAETEEVLYGDVKKRLVGYPVRDSALERIYGRRSRSVVFDTDNPDTLNRLAQAYFTRYSRAKYKIEVKAVDLGDINVDIEKFNLGDSVRVFAKTFGLDQWMYITEQEINLLDIAHNQITLTEGVDEG